MHFVAYTKIVFADYRESLPSQRFSCALSIARFSRLMYTRRASLFRTYAEQHKAR